jgi:hypothetical protein
MRKFKKRDLLSELQFHRDVKASHYVAQFANLAMALVQRFAEIPMSNLKHVRDVHGQLAEVVGAIRHVYLTIDSSVLYDLGQGTRATFLTHIWKDQRVLMEDLICSTLRLIKYIEDVVPVIREVKTDDKASVRGLREYGKRISKTTQNLLRDIAQVSVVRERHIMRLLSRVIEACQSNKVTNFQLLCTYEMRHRLLRAQLFEVLDYSATLGFLDSLVGRVERKELGGSDVFDFDTVLKCHLGLDDEGPDSTRVCKNLFL